MSYSELKVIQREERACAKSPGLLKHGEAWYGNRGARNYETMWQVGPHDTKLVRHGKEFGFSSKAMRQESRILSKDGDAIVRARKIMD